MKLKYINKLTASLHDKIWGGKRLARLKNVNQFEVDRLIGESWEVSIHPEGSSYLENIPLSGLVSPTMVPYLVKLIDTADHLSVQVHPGDQYAMEYEQSRGKTECWIILDCAPSAGIFLGIKKGINRERFQKAIFNGEDLSQFLNFYETKKGDFFFVPAGTIHAIGKDVFLCEVQQSSGITYRVWDWERLGDDGKPRQLHIKKAMEVIAFDEESNSSGHFKIIRDIFNDQTRSLVKHSDFEVCSYKISRDIQIKAFDNGRMNSCICLEGSFQIVHKNDLENVMECESILLHPQATYKLKSTSGCKILWVG